MDYEIIGGRIVTWALEAHVVDHCNLRCAQCCTLSPWLPDRFVDPGQLERDLTSASRVLAPAVFKLTGGEPSLHPNLVECIEAARASRISPVLSMTTNGWLAPRLPDRVFQLLDRITLSVYASAPLPARTLAHVESRCRAHDVRLTIKPIGVFQEITPASPGDEEQARRVYASCWLRARCHTIHGGRFYPCTRPPHLGIGAERSWDRCRTMGGRRRGTGRGRLGDTARRACVAAPDRCAGVVPVVSWVDGRVDGASPGMRLSGWDWCAWARPVAGSVCFARGRRLS